MKNEIHIIAIYISWKHSQFYCIFFIVSIKKTHSQAFCNAMHQHKDVFFLAANKICNFIVYWKSNWIKISLVVYKWYRFFFLGLRRIINWIMMQRVIMNTDHAKQIIASNFMATESYRTNCESMKLCTHLIKTLWSEQKLYLNKLKMKRWSKTEYALG